MDSNTLNGFEVFEDFMMPGSNVNSNRMPGNENEFEGASEELTDEELEELRKGNKGNKEEEEDVDDPKNKPSKGDGLRSGRRRRRRRRRSGRFGGSLGGSASGGVPLL